MYVRSPVSKLLWAGKVIYRHHIQTVLHHSLKVASPSTAGGITNWIAIETLFRTVPFLIGT